MRKVLIVLTLTMMLSSVALASPLTDYSAGKGSIDLTWRNTEGSISTSNQTIPKTYNLDGSATLGLGHKFAIQYRDFSPKSKDFVDEITEDVANVKMSNREINLLYQLNKNTAAYVGNFNTKLKATDLSDSSDGWTTNGKNLWQVGLISSTHFGPKTIGYAQVAAGKDLTNWEVGLSYQVAKNTELNVSYREVKVDNYTIGNLPETIDYKAKGIGCGITYKF